MIYMSNFLGGYYNLTMKQCQSINLTNIVDVPRSRIRGMACPFLEGNMYNQNQRSPHHHLNLNYLIIYPLASFGNDSLFLEWKRWPVRRVRRLIYPITFHGDVPCVKLPEGVSVLDHLIYQHPTNIVLLGKTLGRPFGTLFIIIYPIGWFE